MNKPMNPYVKLVLAVLGSAVLGLAVWLFVPFAFQTMQQGSGADAEAVYYQMIGTTSTGATVTSVYASTTSGGKDVAGKPNGVLSVTYTPNFYGSSLFLLLEKSIDPWCDTYFPESFAASTTAAATDRYPIFTAGASSTTGIPYTFPTGFTAASGTTYSFAVPVYSVAQCLKLSAKESTTGTKGLLRAQLLMTNQD